MLVIDNNNNNQGAINHIGNNNGKWIRLCNGPTGVTIMIIYYIL